MIYVSVYIGWITKAISVVVSKIFVIAFRFDRFKLGQIYIQYYIFFSRCTFSRSFDFDCARNFIELLQQLTQFANFFVFFSIVCDILIFRLVKIFAAFESFTHLACVIQKVFMLLVCVVVAVVFFLFFIFTSMLLIQS